MINLSCLALGGAVWRCLLRYRLQYISLLASLQSVLASRLASGSEYRGVEVAGGFLRRGLSESGLPVASRTT